MAARITILFVFHMLYFITKPLGSVYAKKQVPCVFFFGDSIFDNGNNNFRITDAKANYLPYGIDYPTGLTGRFSNGKNVPDFLAESLGFDEPIPPFATTKGAKILEGVNYASGGGGILDESGLRTGDVLSMNEQLIKHGNTAFEIAILLGSAGRAREHLNKCLYISNIGNNDYINNYLVPLSTTLYTPQKFAATLINRYRRQLTRLYKYGARKVAICGLGLIGYTPQLRATNRSFEFADSTNKIVQEFNNRLPPLIDHLNAALHAAQFLFINNTNIAQGDPSTLGIKVVDAPCCVVSKITGLCVAGKKPCSQRNDYYFWDNFHPTEIANHAVAMRSYAAASPPDAYPTDIRHLVQPK